MEGPDVMAPSPMLAINELSTRYETPPEPIPVLVWIDGFPFDEDQRADPGWYQGELAEWTLYETHGWTGWVRFSIGPTARFNGRFVAAAIQCNQD